MIKCISVAGFLIINCNLGEVSLGQFFVTLNLLLNYVNVYTLCELLGHPFTMDQWFNVNEQIYNPGF